MRTLYLDCFSGIAGDMFIGALADLGVFQVQEFIEAMGGIALEGYSLEFKKAERSGITGTDFKVIDLSNEHHHRHLADIMEILEKSNLPEEVKVNSARAFGLLAEAEAEVHGTDAESVHFHEVGALDSIIDVIGSFLALYMTKADRVLSSPVNLGMGTVSCAHGIMPVPAPATALLLKGIPVFSKGDPLERTTPTGALILKTAVSSFGPIPQGVIESSGYGSGDRDTEYPNLLRALILREETPLWASGEALVMEANMDDMNPQDFQALSESLFEKGAWDVFLTSVMMKKNRPGVKLTCVAPLGLENTLAQVILKNSTSIGLRFKREFRYTLKRHESVFMSSLGPVRVKSSYMGEKLCQRTLEYDDLKDLSDRCSMALCEIRDKITSELGPWEVGKD